MRENMTNSEQTKWILAETGRQVRDGLKWLVWDNPIATMEYLANELPYQIKQARGRRRDLQAKFEDLIDESFLDRANTPPRRLSVTGEAELVRIEVRKIIRRNAPVIDGILVR